MAASKITNMKKYYYLVVLDKPIGMDKPRGRLRCFALVDIKRDRRILLDEHVRSFWWLHISEKEARDIQHKFCLVTDKGRQIFKK